MSQEHIIVIFEHYKNLPTIWQQEFYRAGSGGDYVHSEIIDPQRNFIRSSAWVKGGVSFRDISKLKNPENYVGYLIPTPFSYEIHQFHISQLGKPYDKFGLLLNMYLDQLSDFKERWFCSEINYFELKQIAHINIPNLSSERVTPMMLKLMLEKSGYKALSLAQLLQGKNNY
jgi:hypothetical protein